MKKEQLAELLNGRQYREEITNEEIKQAKESGLVVVFGASDDLMELRGAIDDELDMYNGGSAYINIKGTILDHEDVTIYQSHGLPFFEIKAIWLPNTPDCSWLMTTQIPSASFDIMEYEDLYCRGLVFSLSELAPKAVDQSEPAQ